MAKDNSVSSVVRTIRVVRHIVDSERPVTFNDLHANLGIAKTTLFRILASLRKAGWIEKTGASYQVGIGVLQLGMRALGKMEVRKKAIPWVDKLSRLTGETAHLVVLSGKRGLIVEVCDGPKHIKISSRPGTFTHLHCSAAGKVLLAFAVQEEVESFLNGETLDAQTKNTITDMEELKKEIAKVVRKGYAVDEMEYYDNVRCVAAPVHDVYGRTVAALGVTAPAMNFKPRQLPSVARTVKEIADCISRSMGEVKA
jgi:DNA-binding IclR family transcriptional regulator